jgi:hypothetical protein
MLHTLDIEKPTPALLLALAGWAAFEREVCLVWLDHPEVDVGVVKEQLLAAFAAVLEATARHDEQARRALERLAADQPGG